ncbi:single-stranded DNA-binding protein [Edaphobacter aggregans]|uniref:single-stranded DNA-binding protein n=1 Tax=Edaphobacter aggregans TaxID=570835 RepID=UPI000A059A46|nr:single-stranded DNA-binding protein [Edaphobacter aggregans]
MAKGINKVSLLGNVGRDPEIKSTAVGMIVANFSLSTADRLKDQQGNWNDAPGHTLVAFGRTAEVVRDYVKKGSRIFVEGKLQTRSWDDKESGAKKHRTEIIVNELVLLDWQGGDWQGSSRPHAANSDRTASGYAALTEGENRD